MAFSPLIRRCDVTDRAACFQLIERARTATGGAPIDILINNAGIMPCRPLLQQHEPEIRRTFAVNVFAHLWLIQAVLPDWLRPSPSPTTATGHRRHIVALSSVAGLGGLPNLVPYCASKFAVRGAMEALAEELRQLGGGDGAAQRIGLTTVCPYMVDTGLCERPYVRFGWLLPLLRPERVAAAVIGAQRRGERVASLPAALMWSERVLRLWPVRCTELLADFMRTGVEAVEAKAKTAAEARDE